MLRDIGGVMFSTTKVAIALDFIISPIFLEFRPPTYASGCALSFPITKGKKKKKRIKEETSTRATI